MTALTAAYSTAEDWLDELLVYLEANRDYAVDYIRKNIPQIKVCPPDGTYLLWLDCSALGLTEEDLNHFFLDQAKVRMNAGYRIGCPRALLTEGLERIRAAVAGKVQE